MARKFATILLLASMLVATIPGIAANFKSVPRKQHCTNTRRPQIHEGQYNVLHQRLTALKKEMRTRASTKNIEVDAYLITSYDEHMSDQLMESDKRLKFLTGFSEVSATAIVTMKSAVIWVDSQYQNLADLELNCDWQIFINGQDPSIPDWLAHELTPDSRVGADPRLVPHGQWVSLEKQLQAHFIKLIKVDQNLVDIVWGGRRPQPRFGSIQVHPVQYAGEKWDVKLNRLRSNLTALKCEAIIVTSLTEIAYILNLRGNDIPYTPVFKAYLLISNREIILHTNRSRINTGLMNHLRAHHCHNEYCVQIQDYDNVWGNLHTLSQRWNRILVPSAVAFDQGASEAIFSSLPRELIMDRPSPIVLLRAQKNDVERHGMRKAHIRDGAAMAEVLSYLEEKFLAGDHFTELSLAKEIDRRRKIQDLSEGVSFRTVVASGTHSSIPHYAPMNRTDFELTEHGTIVLDCGGQYLDGTTDVSRTIHLGDPNPEQMKAYTNVLIGMIQLSLFTFPENMRLTELDAMARGSVWEGHKNDYPFGMGHGVGSYLSVKESPISESGKSRHGFNTFKEGYFFSYEPGFYKTGDFGIRLENVLEVHDTGNVHTSGNKFLSFQDITLVPFEPKLIDRSMLTSPQIKWLNDYNARIRQQVGEELKRKQKMDAFYWMMNKTRNIPEHRSDLDGSGSIAALNHRFLYSAFGVCLFVKLLILN
ncbi:uncharacterized protein LOC129742016 [Uranotaenia lowii]|uniref:uncharacterized protein LOC129742016 n=1 Tax=Uranotaenia lowii TaxID=190385 RepID=UPI00247AA235|nr:uncharacterized protein LOC129742016 [Uranotaenia lowii]